MRREPLLAAALVVLVLLAGCTSPPKSPPSPKNPSGSPTMDAAQAVTAGRNYMYQLYAGSAAVHGFNVTRRLVGSPCSWNGTDAGNATSWVMYFEGIMYDASTYRYIQYALDIHYRGTEVYVTHARVQVRVLTASEVNATAASINAVNLDPYIIVNSHDLFVKADAARWNISANYYLQSINMSLNHNTTAHYAPLTASWEVAYKYYDRSDGSSAVSVVVIDAGTQKILKVEPPK
jgi:hypothetical protein